MVGMTSCEEPSAPANEPMPMTESVSIILRRQVPPRAEAPRSWLGGLPMMPEHVAWPRSVSTEFPERGERALHFMAQIACTDLPPQLWGGLGPRSGWLLLFIDPNHFQPFGPDTLRVMHIETLGTERAAPADLGPVDDGEHSTTNFDYFFYRAEAEKEPRTLEARKILFDANRHKKADPTDPRILEKYNRGLTIMREVMWAHEKFRQEELNQEDIYENYVYPYAELLAAQKTRQLGQYQFELQSALGSVGPWAGLPLRPALGTKPLQGFEVKITDDRLPPPLDGLDEKGYPWLSQLYIQNTRRRIEEMRPGRVPPAGAAVPRPGAGP